MACSTKHYNWRPDVSAVVQQILSYHPRLSANTYKDHPWPGWDEVSVDFWDYLGCGIPAGWQVLHNSRSFLFNLSSAPPIRHVILGHALWTSFGGWSYWAADDHSGRERHLHVTFWK